MAEKESKTTPMDLKEMVGARLKNIRTSAFDLSQKKFAELIDHEDLGANPQNRITLLEKGKGSATIIFRVLHFLHEEGIDINYLFGPTPMRRTADGTVLYAENINDYLDETARSLGETREKIDELMQSTFQVREYIKGSIQTTTS